MCKAAVSVVLAVVFAATPSLAQSSGQSGPKRKVLVKIPADYPELAKRMRVEGSVKLEVIVRPNGEVESSRVIGGHPLLIDAAVAAVSQWKFEVLRNETTEIVQVNFARH